MSSILGLSPSAWLMILASGGIGLTIELVFFARHRRRSPSDRTDDGRDRR